MNDSPREANRTIRVLVDPTDPGAMAALVPQFLRFVPSNSMVLICSSRQNPAGISFAIRAELPPPGKEEMVAGALIGTLQRNDVVSVWLVLIGTAATDREAPSGGWTEAGQAGPPYRALVEAMSRTLDEAKILVIGSMWVPRLESGQTWWSYEGGRSDKLVDLGATEFAAARAFVGSVTYGSREELVETLSPLPEGVLGRTSELLSAGAPLTDDDAALALVQAAVDEAPDLSGVEACERVAELVAALWVPRVRDSCMALALGPKADRAQALWLALTKATPAPWRAVPASLLAVSAYMLGEGALARAALDSALAAEPGHNFATLLEAVLTTGIPAEKLREILTLSMLEGDLPS